MAHFEAKPLAHKNWNGWHISKCNIQEHLSLSALTILTDNRNN